MQFFGIRELKLQIRESNERDFQNQHPGKVNFSIFQKNNPLFIKIYLPGKTL